MPRVQIMLVFHWVSFLFALPWVLLFAGLGEWPTGLAQTVSQDEVNALYDLYSSTNGSAWAWYDSIPGVPWNFTGYDPGSGDVTVDPCLSEWQGVRCDCPSSSVCNIVGLNLTNHKLNGYIPSSLDQLSNLISLCLAENSITDIVPPSLGNIIPLQVLMLQSNELYGSIPGTLGDLTDLQWLDLSRNMLNGSIPDTLFNSLDNLGVFLVFNNHITGTIPSNVSRLSNLTLFNVHNNSLEGNIPSFTASNASLTTLTLSFNVFTGTFPLFLFNTTALYFLNLNHNLLDGELPDLFSGSMALGVLNIGANLFEGPLPPSFCTVTSLSSVDLSYNRLNGPLLDCLGDLTNIKGFVFSETFFTGTIPQTVSKWQRLNSFIAINTMFHGRVNDTFVGMPDLTNLAVPLNSLSGPVPGANEVWPHILQISYFGNRFTGTLPEAYAVNAPNHLYSLNVNDNLLKGTVSPHYSNLSIIVVMDLANNRFTGPLLTYNNTPRLCLLIAGDNYFTGTMSEAIGQISALIWVNVSHNLLNGTLPQVWTATLSLTELDVSQNQFTGTVPESISRLEGLEVLYLARNKFSGSLSNLVNSTLQQHVVSIDVSHNFFTGTIPTEPFYINTLSLYIAATNCLSGTIPEDICRSPVLKILVLDGVSTAERCRQYIFPFLQSFILTKALQGTVPACLFSMENLTALHLSSNYLSGSLPNNISMKLVNLSLSHNFIEGTIPYILQRKIMTNLDLSYNRFSGYLIDDFPFVLPNGSLYMEVNRLSGNIPAHIQPANKISILDGNLFACDFHRDSLPDNDPNRKNFVCGSHSLDVSVIAWGVLFGSLLLATMAYMAFTEKSPLGLARESWFLFVKLSGYVMSTTTSKEQLEKIGMLYKVFAASRLVTAALAAFIVVLLMPTYIVLPSRLYENSYGWTPSAVLLGGETAAIVLSIGFACVILLLLVLVWRVNTELRQGDASSGSSIFSVKDSAAREALFISILVFINTVVMLGVDVVYVLVILSSNRGIVLLFEILVAVIKVTWNEMVLWNLIPLLRQCLEDSSEDNLSSLAVTASSSSPDASGSLSENNPHSSASILRRTSLARRLRLLYSNPTKISYSASDVLLMATLTQFNNIIIPAIAIACVSSNCFREVFVPSSTIDDVFYTITCALVGVDPSTGLGECLQHLIRPSSVTFNPPYIYSYMCASSIIVNYTPVYVFLFLIVGVLLPVAKFALRYFLHTDGDNQLKQYLLQRVSALYLPVSTEEKLHLTQSHKLLSKEKVTVRLVAMLGLLVSFGAIYPPMAVMAGLTVYSYTYSEQVLQGLVIREADEQGLGWYRERLASNSENINQLFIRTLYFIIPYAGIAFGYLVFDTLAYTNDWKEATAAAVLLAIGWPFSIRIVRVMYLIFTRQMGLLDEELASMIGRTSYRFGGSTQGSSSIVENPLRSFTTDDGGSAGSSGSTLPNLRPSVIRLQGGRPTECADEFSPGRASIISTLGRKSAAVRDETLHSDHNDML